MQDKVVYCNECGEPVWVTRYGANWQMTFRPGTTFKVDGDDGNSGYPPRGPQGGGAPSSASSASTIKTVVISW